MTSTNPTQSSPDECWKKAYDALDDSLRVSIGSARTGKNDILAAVLQTADQKREICIHKQWKFKLPGGETIIIRDVVDKIATWVKLFVSVGDVAMNYDPTTAALPWAAVRFVLQAAINETQVHGSIVADLETIARLISRYREFERIYLNKTSSMRQQIEDGLTRLYTNVLKYLATAVRYFHSNTFSRGLKNALSPLDRGPMENILQQEAELLKVAGLSDSEQLHFFYESMLRLADQTSALRKALDETKYLELLRWMSSSPYARHQEELSGTRMQNSATWVLNHHEFLSWGNSSSSSILLLYGIAGSGKSNICSAIVDSHLQANAPTAPMAYYYCADCEFEPERSQPGDVMRSILRQLTICTNTTQPMVRDTLLSEFDRRLARSKVDGMDIAKLTVNDCAKLILDVAMTDPISIVVDALDTINEHDQPTLVNALVSIARKSSNVVKVFLTSRHSSLIFSLLEDAKAGVQFNSASHALPIPVKYLEVNRDDAQQDVERYVQLVLTRAVRDRRLLREDPSTELLSLLSRRLVAGAGEMFQWVNIQVEYLCQLNQEEDIIAAVESHQLATLDEIYFRIFDRIMAGGTVSQEIALRAFSWVMYMREPISPKAFLAAAFAQTSISDVVKRRKELTMICSNLIVFDSKSDTFRFSHQSAQEFLQKHLFTSTPGQKILAACCLQVCMDGPSPASDAGDLDALYRYAALYWGYHCSQAALSDQKAIIEDQIVSFVYDEPGDVSLSFMEWLHHTAKVSEDLADDHPMKTSGEAVSSPKDSPLFVASLFGMECLLNDDALGTEPVDWDQKNHKGHTGLYLASATGNLAIVNLLLANKADPNIECGRRGNAIRAACFGGHTAVVQLLLEHGASTRVADGPDSALEACFHGHQEKSAIALLKHAKIINNVEDFDAALGGAAQAGFLEVLEQLNKLSFAPQRADDKIKIKTTRAIKGGHASVLAGFLKNKGNVSDLLPRGSIAIAAIYGHEEVIELLAGLGIAYEDECHLGPPLRCAALMNHEAIVRQILRLGADINHCGQHGTALQAASMRGHIRIVQLLLRSGAQVNQIGGKYGTALQAAAFHGHREAVEALLDAGAEMHVRGSKGVSRDAFHAASEGGHYGVVQLMLDRGFRFYYAPPPPALLAPLKSPYRNLIKSYFAERNARNKDEAVAEESVMGEMQHIPYANVFSVMEELGNPSRIESGKQTPSLGRPYAQGRLSGRENYALEASAASESYETVSTLLDQKTGLGISNDDVLASLRLASTQGHFRIFVRLFSTLSPPIRAEQFLAVLQTAAKNGHTKIVDFGIKKVLALIDGWSEKDLKALVRLASLTEPAISESLLSAASAKTPAEDMTHLLQLGLVEAARAGHVHMVEQILRERKDFHMEAIRKAFEAACRGGHAPVASALIGATDMKDVQILVTKGLQIGASKGHVALMAYLIDILSPTSDRKTTLTQALVAAAKNGHVDAVKALLHFPNAFEDTTVEATPALASASFNGHEKAVEVNLRAGADVNAVVPDVPEEAEDFGFSGMPWRALTLTDCGQHLETLPDISFGKKCQDASGLKVNALQAALAGIKTSRNPKLAKPWRERQPESEHEKVVQVLLRHGSDPNLLGGQNVYPIIVAAGHCSEMVVGWLIEAGADVNAIAGARNAVMAAAGRETLSYRILQRLIAAGAHLESEFCSINDLLDACLDYFIGEGRFCETETLEDAMMQGPGAVAQVLLEKLPLTNSKDVRFGSLLQHAVAICDQKFVNALLDRSIDVNSSGALQVAALFGHAELTKHLIDAGADPNVLGGRHGTALRAAVEGGHPIVVEILLENGAKVDEADIRLTQGPTRPLLDVAIESGNKDIIMMLVSAGVNAITCRGDWCHPLITACKSNSIEVIKCLLDSGAPAGVHGRRETGMAFVAHEASPLHMACCYGREDVVQLLLEWQTDMDIDLELNQSGTPLQFAASGGHIGIVCLLLEAGARVNRVSSIESWSYGRHHAIGTTLKQTALSIAAKGGHLGVVQELLAAGASIYDPKAGFNALIDACKSQSHAVIEVILEAMHDLENCEQTIMEAFEVATDMKSDRVMRLLSEYMDRSTNIFHKACIGGSLSLVRAMLDGDMSVDAEGKGGVRALTLAARHLQGEIVKLLVERGADINHSDHVYGTALNAAVYGCAMYGLPQGARPSQPTMHVQPPRYASEIRLFDDFQPNAGQASRCEDIVQFLLDSGASVTSEPRVFGHALHLAGFLGNMRIIQMLLSSGAQANSVAGYFGIPLISATLGGHFDAVKLFLQEGNDINYEHPELGTPLFLASQRKNLGITRLIFDSGGDPSIPGPNGSSSLSNILKAYVPSSSDADEWAGVMRAILRHPPGLKLQSNDLTDAVRISKSISSPIHDLLNYDKSIIVPEEAVVACLDQYPVKYDNLRLLLGRTGDLGVTGPILSKAFDQKAMSMLLEHRPCCPITSEIIEEERKLFSWDIMELLLRQEPSILPTERMVNRILDADDRNIVIRQTKPASEVLEYIWARNPDLQVTAQMLEDKKLKASTVRVLLSHASNNFSITHRMFYSPRFRATAEVTKMLLRHDTTFHITEEMITSMVRSEGGPQLLDIFLQHDPSIFISEAIFLAAFGSPEASEHSERLELVRALLRHRKTLVFTDKMRRVVDECFPVNKDPEVREAYYGLENAT